MRRARAAVVRLVRCHPLTWLVMALVAIALGVIMIPGQQCAAPSGFPSTWVERQREDVYFETLGWVVDGVSSGDKTRGNLRDRPPRLYDHGWPSPFLVRSVAARVKPAAPPFGGGPQQTPAAKDRPVSWSNYDNWPFESVIARVNYGGVFVNSLVALLIVGVVGAATERWVRRRGGAFRWRLIDLLVGLTVVALLFSWWRYETRAQAIERRAATELSHSYNSPRFWKDRAIRRYVGPEWLARLVGGESQLPLMHHTTAAVLGPSDRWEEDLQILTTLPYLDEIRVAGGLPIEAIEQLKKCRGLNRLHLDLHSVQKGINGAAPSAPGLVGPGNLDALAELDIEALRLRGDLFLAEDVDRALETCAPTRVEIFRLSMTDEEYDDLWARYPDTTFVSLGVPPQPITSEQTVEIRKLDRAEWRNR